MIYMTLVISSLRPFTTYMHHGNKYITVRKEITIEITAILFTIVCYIIIVLSWAKCDDQL